MSFAPHPFSLRQLQYVLAVAGARSFRRAAELCHVSQPSLSAQIAAMEDAIGVRLFERDRRHVVITAAGEEILAHARRALLDADDVVETARRLGDPLAGRLRIGIIPTISPYLLPDVVPLLRKRQPRLTVQWTEDKTDHLVERVTNGALDGACLALGGRVGELDHEVVGDDPFVLAAPVGHELGAKRTPAKLEELRDADVLLLEDGHCLREQALAVCSTAHAHELGFRATSLGTLVQMVASGAGITLLPGLALPTESRRAELAIRRFANPPPKRTVVLAWRRQGALGPALRAVAGTMREAFAKAMVRGDR